MGISLPWFTGSPCTFAGKVQRLEAFKSKKSLLKILGRKFDENCHWSYFFWWLNFNVWQWICLNGRGIKVTHCDKRALVREKMNSVMMSQCHRNEQPHCFDVMSLEDMNWSFEMIACKKINYVIHSDFFTFLWACCIWNINLSRNYNCECYFCLLIRFQNCEFRFTR